MNQQDIIQMAREAGFDIDSNQFMAGMHVYADGCITKELERFAELVAAKEREACELMHDYEELLAPIGHSVWGEGYQEGWITATCAYRDAIRARNNKETSEYTLSIEDMVEAWVVELSIDNGGYKPTIVELVEFLSERELSLKQGHFDFLVNKWCQK